MLDRTVVKEFLLEEMSEAGIYVPKGIIKRELVEAFVDSRKKIIMNG